MNNTVAALPSVLVSCIAAHEITHLLAVPQLLSAVAAAAAVDAAVNPVAPDSPCQNPDNAGISTDGAVLRSPTHPQHHLPMAEGQLPSASKSSPEQLQEKISPAPGSEYDSLAALPNSVKLKQSPLRSLVYIASSGDVLPLQHVRKLQACIAPEAVLLNIYGSTETTADCLVQQVLPGTSIEISLPSTDVQVTAPQFVPLGHPLGCTDAYLLPWNDQNSPESDAQSQQPVLKRKRDPQLYSTQGTAPQPQLLYSKIAVYTFCPVFTSLLPGQFVEILCRRRTRWLISVFCGSWKAALQVDVEWGVLGPWVHVRRGTCTGRCCGIHAGVGTG